MSEDFLYQKLRNEFVERNIEAIELPNSIPDNINPKFQIRAYQKKAFQSFIYYQKENFKEFPIHLLFNMATGSGKTLMMAGCILYLYEKGYRNFLFFVNATNILEKTKDNFLNKNSSKYLFNEKIVFNGKEININEVSNFNESKEEDINIFFTTIQGLHQDLTGLIKENAITYDDFKDKQIVFLSDEAHHLNVKTTKSTNNLEKNWEETIDKILRYSNKNILLEFTATIDLANEDIKKKYTNKILYRYDLINFRKDKYSKEIKTLSLDSDLDQIMLHAILLSQYRLKIAEKNGIILKPVLLFKAQKTISQSNDNEKRFKELIENLNIQQLEKLLNINFLPKENTILVKAFSYLDKIYQENYQRLIDELQQDFSNEKILNVNDETSKKDNQLSLNSLEDNNNPIRAIFAVNKLNEGWDVLNLFDIVRVYDTRDGEWQRNGKYKAGKTTLSEAQLIGRGARYFPFAVEGEQDISTRKYDEDIENELKILEELHYHSKYNSRYLDELDKALIEQGLIDEKKSIKKEEIKIKDITEKSFYNTKQVLKNEQIPTNNQNKKSFADYQIQKFQYSYQIETDEIKEKKIFEKEGNNQITSQSIHRIELKDINHRIFHKAFNQNKDFWTFKNIKKYFGRLKSIDDLLDGDFFYSIEIKTNKKEFSNQEKLNCLNYLLPQISQTITKNANHKKGTKTFYSYPINKIFRETKELKFDINNTQFKKRDIEQIKEYFLHDKLIGTSEEDNFIKFFASYLEKLEKNYAEVKLLRNNRELKLYRFDDGEAFEPDFILFLTQKNGKEISYQVFIESKGNHLLEYDKEKEKFLKQIKEKYRLVTLFEKGYRLLGLKFYNKNNENEFKEDFEEELLEKNN